MSSSSKSRNWCFTFNNYTDDDVFRIMNLPESDPAIEYLIFGREVAESGTKHLQGFVRFNKQRTFTFVSKCFTGCHLTIARNVAASIQYCKKDGDFEESGTYEDLQGKRNDIEDFKESVKAGVLSLRELRDLHSKTCAKYPRFVMDYVTDHIPSRIVPDHSLHEWQTSLFNILKQPPDDRTIVFVVDPVGNRGKSWFAHWYTNKNTHSQVIQPGKLADMAYILDPLVTVLFIDAPRSKQGEYIQYDFLEQVKNGHVFSPKYESKSKQLQRCHVVCLMNEMPDMTKLSEDRYFIIQLDS